MTHKLVSDAFKAIKAHIDYLSGLDAEVLDANPQARKAKWWREAVKARDSLDEIAKALGGN